MDTIPTLYGVGVFGVRTSLGKDTGFARAESLRSIKLAHLACFKISGACWVACLVALPGYLRCHEIRHNQAAFAHHYAAIF